MFDVAAAVACPDGRTGDSSRSRAPLSVDNALAVLRSRAWATHRTAGQVAIDILNDAIRSEGHPEEMWW